MGEIVIRDVANVLVEYQFPFQCQAADVPRFCAVTLRQRRRGGIESGKAEAAAVDQVSQLDSGRGGRSRPAGGNRPSLRRLPKVSIHKRPMKFCRLFYFVKAHSSATTPHQTLAT